MNDVVIGLLSALVGLLAGYGIRTLLGRWQADSIEKQATAKLEDAEKEARSRLKEAEIQARAEVVKAREEFEQSTKVRRKELEDFDERLTQREENLDRKLKVVEVKEQAAAERQTELQTHADNLNRRQQELERLIADGHARLQRLAGMTQEEARRELRQKVEDEVRAETGALLRRLQEEARETAERDAQKLVTLAVQRFAAPHANESMTCTVALPSDDIKGRIIGREGRNVRAIEAATGMTLLIDDTPEAVVISGFDPIRREIARQALEALVADGRIHPTRIEEAVAKAQAGMEETFLQAGQEAAYQAKQQHVDTELLRKLGRLKFRTSFSQNVLQHSIEVSNLMGLMASDLGLDPLVARRVGLFHDIGKSADHEVEGGHAQIGAEILRQAHEDAIVVNAVAAHHEDVEAHSLYAVLCSAADAISSSRPGARSESTGIYVQRLEKLEAIANAFKGVRSSYAIQAGRELRVIIDPTEVSDNDAMLMAREISRKIESELRYPGQIRVVVIREKRCVEYAR
ncbi:MAG: ribonuclease Y [Kiritimatiellae bacterium]|nr:ribonuclease Y [Kiritimatiellia bacterium]